MVESSHSTNFEKAEFKNIQIAYLDSIIYILKFGYIGLVFLFFILIATNYKATTAQELLFFIGFIIYPFVVFYLEIFIYNAYSYVTAVVFGNVLPPPSDKNSLYATSAVYIN